MRFKPAKQRHLCRFRAATHLDDQPGGVNRAARGLLRRLRSVVSNRRVRPCRRVALAGGDQMQFDQLKRREFMTGL
jgi:hypothetical protein